MSGDAYDPKFLVGARRGRPPHEYAGRAGGETDVAVVDVLSQRTTKRGRAPAP